MSHVRRFMWARRVQTTMDDWNELPLTTVEEEGNLPQQTPPQGLEVEASTLKAAFEHDSPHLNEVRERHIEVLATAGMLPETALASHTPERALSWLVSTINGRLHPDGLTIPLLGAQPDAIVLRSKQTDDATLVRLTVADGDETPLVRELPLPLEASGELTATLVNGYLHLRW